MEQENEKLFAVINDQEIRYAEFKLDAAAQKIADEAAKSSACIPIGEGENCW